MTEVVIDKIWATFEEIEEVVGCEGHPWENVWEEGRLAHGLALHGGRVVCLCRRKNCANEEMQGGRKKLTGIVVEC